MWIQMLVRRNKVLCKTINQVDLSEGKKLEGILNCVFFGDMLGKLFFTFPWSEPGLWESGGLRPPAPPTIKGVPHVLDARCTMGRDQVPKNWLLKDHAELRGEPWEAMQKWGFGPECEGLTVQTTFSYVPIKQEQLSRAARILLV